MLEFSATTIPLMKATSTSPKTVEQWLTAAKQAMQKHSYKDAITAYKELLKREKRSEWEQELAKAYRARALEIAGKGMYQEAIVLWENQLKLCPKVEVDKEYAIWLLQAGQFPKLASLMDRMTESFGSTPLGRRLPEALALMALENDKLLAHLPRDHAIVKHQPIIKRALTAYAAKRDDEVEECLRQISSRSPYRNVRLLLKALQTLEKDRDGALVMLEKIEVDSACKRLVNILGRYARTAGPEILHFSELAAKQQTLIGKLNGYQKTQLNLLRDVKKVATTHSDRVAFETVINHRQTFGDEMSRRYCHSALIDYPAGLALFERAFGKLSPFEHYRVQALHAEQDQNYPLAASIWRKSIGELQKNSSGTRDVVTEALIFRHIAQLAATEVPEVAIDALERSLELDPDDKESYLILIRLYEETDQAKKSQEWLDKGLKRYSRDVDLLVLAMQSASRRKAFKKAAGFAKTLLEIDPINSQGRQFLIDAHLGHARKQFQTGRLDLAKQELDQARPLDPHRRQASLALIEGLWNLKQGDSERTARLLEEGLRIAGGGIGAQFLLFMETLSVNLPLSAPLRHVANLPKNYVAGRHDLMNFVKLLGHYQKADKRRLAETLDKLTPILKKSFKQADLSSDDRLNLCQTLAQSGQYPLLLLCAQEALRSSSFAPGLIYFEIYAKCKGEAKNLSMMDERRLQMAHDRAIRAKDRRSIVLIEGFFREYDEAHHPEPDDFFPFLWGDDDSEKGGKGLDPKLMPQLLIRLMKLSEMPPQELIHYITDGHEAFPLKGMKEADLMNLAVNKLLTEMGIDPAALDELVNLPGPGKKPGKVR
jgi:tetratricopeptide (TPR) repeat protein